MSAAKRMEARWQVLIVAWALASSLVPGGLLLSAALAVWLAWRHSPYLWFFVAAVAAVGLAVGVLGLAGGAAAPGHVHG